MTRSSRLPLNLSRRLTFVLAIVLISNQHLSYIMPIDDKSASASATRLHKRSPPIFVPLSQVYFPQQQQHRQQNQQYLQPSRATTVSPTWTGHLSISDPANIPSPLGQEDARYLEQYMRNDLALNSRDSPLNLANMNHRTNKPVARKMSDSSPPTQKHGSNKQMPATGQNQRSDFNYPFVPEEHEPELFGRKGHAGDLIITKQPESKKALLVQQGQQMKQNLVHSIFHPPILNKFQENCITRSAQQAGMCEDHLIKRLTQDATEGRTVVDVGRRVCCALFWHKECIDSIVLKACPDSTPVAADYILGARKIDLATSCQRFNREGCNGSPEMSSTLSRTLPIVVAIFVMVLCL